MIWLLVQSSITQGITIKIKLDLQHNEDVSIIINTMEQYRQACNYISEYIFTHGFQLNPLKLQKEIYKDIRVRFRVNYPHLTPTSFEVEA